MTLPLFGLEVPPPFGPGSSPQDNAITLPFYTYLFQPVIFIELYNWAILMGWTAIWLLLAALAFFWSQPPHTRRAWWQYLALLLVGALSILNFAAAYNSYQYWLYLTSLLPAHINMVVFMMWEQQSLAVIQSSLWQFALSAGVFVLLIIGTLWRVRRAFTRKLDLAPGKYYGRLLMSLFLAAIGLCGLVGGIFLITKLFPPLYYGPQVFSYLSDQPTTLELIGLFIVSLGGPLILLLLALASFVERQKLMNRFASRERRLPAMEKRASQRT